MEGIDLPVCIQCSIEPSLGLNIVDNVLVQAVEVDVLNTTVDLKTAMFIGDSNIACGFLLVAVNFSDKNDLIAVFLIDRESVQLVED